MQHGESTGLYGCRGVWGQQWTIYQLHPSRLSTAETAKYESGYGTGEKSSPLEVGGEPCEACLHCGWWGVKLLIWELKHEAFHIATGDVFTAWSGIWNTLLLVLNLQLLQPFRGSLLRCEVLGGGGARGMNTGFLLAVLASLCVSCPTTAEWDGWLLSIINTAVFNWCPPEHLCHSEERRQSGCLVLIPEQWRRNVRDGARCSGYGSACLA